MNVSVPVYVPPVGVPQVEENFICNESGTVTVTGLTKPAPGRTLTCRATGIVAFTSTKSPSERHGPPRAETHRLNDGGTSTVKFVLLAPVPPGPVTAIGPVIAPAGTVAVIWISKITLKMAATPPKVTAVAPLKFAPEMVTLAPASPLVGKKEVTCGTGGGGTVTVKSPELVPVPAGVVTVIGPVVAPLGTVAVI